MFTKIYVMVLPQCLLGVAFVVALLEDINSGAPFQYCHFLIRSFQPVLPLFLYFPNSGFTEVIQQHLKMIPKALSLTAFPLHLRSISQLLIYSGKKEHFPSTIGKVYNIDAFHKNTPDVHNLNEKGKRKKKT